MVTYGVVPEVVWVVDPLDRTLGSLVAFFAGGVKAGVQRCDVRAGANWASRFRSASGHVLLKFV